MMFQGGIDEGKKGLRDLIEYLMCRVPCDYLQRAFQNGVQAVRKNGS